MMKVETFARELETKGIRLALRDEKIICSGSSEALTPDLIETLRRRKPEIQEFLKSSLGKDEPTPSPADIPPAPVESVPGQDEGVNPYTEQKPQNGDSAPPPAPALDDWRKRYIEKKQAGWSEERIQALADELKSIEAYRRARGPVPSGPSPAGSIPRAEIFAAIGEAMSRLGAIWPSFLPPDPVWQDKVNAAAEGPRQTFLDTVKQWEKAETTRAEAYMYAIRRIVAGWPDECRRRFSIMVESFMRAERGQGITVRALSKNAAISKAFFDMRPFIPDDTPTDSPAPDDGLPFHDLHPNTREILLRHWNTWDAARRARFVEDVRDVMKRTGYGEGNACAFCLQTAGPVAPGRPPAMTPEEKQALHKIMWPTPPSSPQEPKSTVPGPDIAKIVSRWPKAARLEFAGRVGKYSNEMPINQAMARAYSELKDDAQENKP